MALGTPLLILLLAVLGIAVGIFLIVFLIVPLFKGIRWLVVHIFRFVFGMILDALRFVGSIVTAVVMIPLIIGNVLVGRWSGATHYGRSLQSEVVNGGLSIYRIVIGHPARFLLLSALTEGLEKRLPAAVAAAPNMDRPSGRAAQFDGYTIVGSLKAGGSGGKLYVANPDAGKRAAFDRAGHVDVQQVVIKTFSLDDGSELPQIVRESRSLDAAKKLGLVLDHELSNSRFYYAMKYVPGQPLGLVTPQLHAASGGMGLDGRHLRLGLSYVADLLGTLENYHRGGLWHKDVKPDNIIVDGQSAHLVDFGLVTPLRSSMTLTTHGTEYFRDPELVRLALKGVKVSEVDGARFDVYAVGAVLYSIIENSFPAHGVLSQVSRQCPEALRWVIRRAMADYDKRYPSAAAMLLDVRCVLAAEDPFAVKPIDLPSMQGQVPASPRPFEDAVYRPAYVSMPPHAAGEPFAAQAAYAGSPVPPPMPAPGPAPAWGKAKISIKNWWTGEFSVTRASAARAAAVSPLVTPFAAASAAPAGFAASPAPFAAPVVRRSAAEQLQAARSRAASARERASTRMAGRRGARHGKVFSTEPNAGVFMALFFFLGVCVLLVGGIVAFSLKSGDRRNAAVYSNSDWDGGWATMTLPVEPVTAPVPPTPPSVDGVRVSEASAPESPVVPSAAVDVEEPVANVFVWIDMPRPLSAPDEAAIRSITGRLESFGFYVWGDLPESTITGDARQELLDRQASLLALTSGLPWDSEELRKAITRWASEQDDVDLVLQFHGAASTIASGQAAAGAGRINCSLVTRPSDDAEERGLLKEAFGKAQRVIQRGELE